MYAIAMNLDENFKGAAMNDNVSLRNDTLCFFSKCVECNISIEPGTAKFCSDCYNVEQTLLELEGRLDSKSDKCTICKNTISSERLAAIDTTVCVNCSNVPKVFGLMDYAHKTAGTVVIVDGADKEAIRRMKNVYERKR